MFGAERKHFKTCNELSLITESLFLCCVFQWFLLTKCSNQKYRNQFEQLNLQWCSMSTMEKKVFRKMPKKDRKNSVTLEYFQVDAEILTFVLIYSLGLQVDFRRVQFWRARSYSSGRERHRLWNGIVDSFQTPWTVLLILLKQSPAPTKHVLNQKPEGICVCKDNNHHTEVTCMAKRGSKGTTLQVTSAFPARELCTQLASD